VTTVRNWREWFVPPEPDGGSACEVEDDVRSIAGSGHRNSIKPPHLRDNTTPRCASCQEPVDFDTGMHLLITSEWRIHIACFAEVLERHYEDGEVIDLTTGTIRKIEET
jgi:hypothetical protein